MNIQAQIDRTILNFSPGCIFGYGDLPLYSKSPNGVVKAISRLIGKNKLKRLSKGIFYRPKKGILGDIKPSDDELLRTFCFRNDQLVGYITGASLYNRLGLTTQIPKTITIAIKGARQKKNFGTIRVKLISSRAPVSKQNRPLLELLDALKDINQIQDAVPSQSLKILTSLIKNLTIAQQKKLVQLALQYYTASTRALLGLAFNSLNSKSSDELKTSLNPVTIYKIGLDDSQWSDAKNWNIQ